MRGASNQRELVEPSRELPEKEDSNQQSAGKPPADLLLRQKWAVPSNLKMLQRECALSAPKASARE